MSGKSNIDKYMSSGVILIATLFLYVALSVLFYGRLSTMFWIVSAFFILFQAEHLYNFIGRNKQQLLKNIVGTFWHRLLAFILPALIVATTWWIANVL